MKSGGVRRLSRGGHELEPWGHIHSLSVCMFAQEAPFEGESDARSLIFYFLFSNSFPSLPPCLYFLFEISSYLSLFVSVNTNRYKREKSSDGLKVDIIVPIHSKGPPSPPPPVSPVSFMGRIGLEFVAFQAAFRVRKNSSGVPPPPMCRLRLEERR